MERETLTQYEEGTIVRIGEIEVALAAWDDDQQLCEDEVVYAGYTREDWDAGVDATYIAKELRREDGTTEWLYCEAGAYNPRFHDDGGLRVVGGWHGGALEALGGRELWED